MRRESGAHGRSREARLLAAAAHLYPGVPAGIWKQAATMADMVWSLRLRQGKALFGERVLNPAHFEFRQGDPSSSTSTFLRRRATDAALGPSDTAAQ
jgi:hypothetical protein